MSIGLLWGKHVFLSKLLLSGWGYCWDILTLRPILASISTTGSRHTGGEGTTWGRKYVSSHPKKGQTGHKLSLFYRIPLCSSCRIPTRPLLHLLWNTVGGPPCVIIGFLKSVSRLQACQLLAYLWSCPKCERTGWTKTLPLGNIADQQICEGIASDRAVSIAWFKGNKFASGQNISSWKMIADNKDTEKRE